MPSWEAVSAKFAEFWSAGGESPESGGHTFARVVPCKENTAVFLSVAVPRQREHRRQLFRHLALDKLVPGGPSGSKASTKKGRLAAKLPAEDAMVQLAEGTAYAEGVADEVVAAARFALGRGLIPGAGGVLLWFNGIVYEQHVESALMMALQQEMQNVQVCRIRCAAHTPSRAEVASSYPQAVHRLAFDRLQQEPEVVPGCSTSLCPAVPSVPGPAHGRKQRCRGHPEERRSGSSLQPSHPRKGI